MTTFNPRELKRAYDRFRDSILQQWNMGRGKESTFKARDVFLMLLTALRNGGQWDIIGHVFRIKGPTFEQLISEFVTVLSPMVYGELVSGLCSKWTIERLVQEGRGFQTFKHALYATDVTFQQSSRPSGNLQEGKKYFSCK